MGDLGRAGVGLINVSRQPWLIKNRDNTFNDKQYGSRFFDRNVCNVVAVVVL